MSPAARASVAGLPAAGDILRWPLPEQGFGNRLLIRALALVARRQVVMLSGLEHVHPDRDPFILAVNHSMRSEAVLLPALLFLHRGGRLIHFLADWNYRLIPRVGLIYRRAETVTVTRKPAKPRLFNVLKPLYRCRLTALERARAALAQGRPVAFFPEGAVNRDPRRLLPGRRGAARLSLETGIAIVPVGICFPHAAPGRPIDDRAVMAIEIGAPLVPPPCAAQPAPLAAVRAWHAAVMGEIGRLSGKAWSAPRWDCVGKKDWEARASSSEISTNISWEISNARG